MVQALLVVLQSFLAVVNDLGPLFRQDPDIVTIVVHEQPGRPTLLMGLFANRPREFATDYPEIPPDVLARN